MTGPLHSVCHEIRKIKTHGGALTLRALAIGVCVSVCVKMCVHVWCVCNVCVCMMCMWVKCVYVCKVCACVYMCGVCVYNVCICVLVHVLTYVHGHVEARSWVPSLSALYFLLRHPC